MVSKPSSPPSEERLEELRIWFVQQATLRHSLGTERRLILDLGLGGIFVEGDEPLPIDEDLEVSFRLPGNSIPVAARCRVIWARAEQGSPSQRLPAGVGLEFVELSAKDRARIHDLLLEHCRREPRHRRFARPWKRPSARPGKRSPTG
jgi:Tfp pilus assembly protein PilZ